MKDNGSTEAALHVCCTARICVANSSAASTISKCHDSRSEITRQCPALLWNSATAAITRWEDGGEITEQMASPHVTSQSCYEWLKMLKYHSETLNCISWWEYISCHCHLYFKNKKGKLFSRDNRIHYRQRERQMAGGRLRVGEDGRLSHQSLTSPCRCQQHSPVIASFFPPSLSLLLPMLWPCVESKLMVCEYTAYTAIHWPPKFSPLYLFPSFSFSPHACLF